MRQRGGRNTRQARRVEYSAIDFSGFRDQPVAGGFKQMVRGVYGNRNVAVSSCRSGGSLEEEAEMMQRLGRHPHIVSFVGLATDAEGVEHLVTEFARFGSLDNVLADMYDAGLSLAPLVQLACAQQVCEALQAAGQRRRCAPGPGGSQRAGVPGDTCG